jgi:hypothetical protein
MLATFTQILVRIQMTGEKKHQQVITAVAEVLTTVTMKVTVFWNVTMCSLTNI